MTTLQFSLYVSAKGKYVIEPIESTIEITNKTQNLVDVRDMVESVLQEASFPKSDMGHIILAVDEAVANVVEHAYAPENEESLITINITIDNKKISIQVIDNGTTFDPSSIENPDMEEHVKDGRRGGLGIYLIRQIMDEVDYHFLEGKNNVLCMSKYINTNKE